MILTSQDNLGLGLPTPTPGASDQTRLLRSTEDRGVPFILQTFFFKFVIFFITNKIQAQCGNPEKSREAKVRKEKIPPPPLPLPTPRSVDTLGHTQVPVFSLALSPVNPARRCLAQRSYRVYKGVASLHHQALIRPGFQHAGLTHAGPRLPKLLKVRHQNLSYSSSGILQCRAHSKCSIKVFLLPSALLPRQTTTPRLIAKRKQNQT